MATAPTEQELAEKALDLLRSGVEARTVIELAIKGGNVIGFKEGSDFAMSALDEALKNV